MEHDQGPWSYAMAVSKKSASSKLSSGPIRGVDDLPRFREVFLGLETKDLGMEPLGLKYSPSSSLRATGTFVATIKFKGFRRREASFWAKSLELPSRFG
jgi:hypothetical protein